MHQEKRRKGIGTALLRELEHEIGGGMVIYCFSRVENHAAHRFYEKNGYEEQASIENFYTVNFGHSGGAVILTKRT